MPKITTDLPPVEIPTPKQVEEAQRQQRINAINFVKEFLLRRFAADPKVPCKLSYAQATDDEAGADLDELDAVAIGFIRRDVETALNEAGWRVDLSVDRGLLRLRSRPLFRVDWRLCA